jgi:hypothetical protein
MQAETTQPKPPSVQSSASTVGQTEGDVLEVSLTTTAMGQASAPAPSAPPTTGGAVLEVEPP